MIKTIDNIINKMSTIRPEKFLLALQYSLKQIFSISSSVKIKEIYVYGSFARGDFNFNSDIDLLLKCDCNIDRKDILAIKNASLVEDYELPDVDIKILKDGSILDPQFMRNLEKDGVLIWRR